MLVLGRLHVRKGIDSKFLELMGPTFCHAIRKGPFFNLVAYLFFLQTYANVRWWMVD